jgi:hypothetical protein
VQGVGVPVPSARSLVRLWAHEAMRVFHDRLVSGEDRAWFCGALRRAVDKHWPQAQFDQVFPSGPGGQPAVSSQDGLGEAGGGCCAALPCCGRAGGTK